MRPGDRVTNQQGAEGETMMSATLKLSEDEVCWLCWRVYKYIREREETSGDAGGGLDETRALLAKSENTPFTPPAE